MDRLADFPEDPPDEAAVEGGCLDAVVECPPLRVLQHHIRNFLFFLFEPIQQAENIWVVKLPLEFNLSFDVFPIDLG